MPSIPIQSITDLAAANVTGNETVPLVQQVGGNYYTYKTPIKNFFYSGAVPPAALSASPLTWTYAGSTGIGTASPAAKLHIIGTPGDASPELRVGSGFGTVSGSIDFYNNLPDNSYNDIVQTGDHAIICGGNSINTAAGLVIAPHMTGTGGIRVTGTGNVGIGTASPSTRLDVGGSITLSQNNNSIKFTDASGTQPQLSMQSDNNFVFYGTGASGSSRAIYNILQRSDTSKFNFSVPLTIAGNNSTFDYGLHIGPNTLGATQHAAIRLDNWVVGQDAAGNGTKDFFIYQNSSNAHRLYVNTSGNVGIGTTSPTAKLDVAGGISVAQSSGINLNGAGTGNVIKGTPQDGASSTLSNVQIQSWFGVGFGPSITGQTIPINENAVFINCRTGTLNARGAITAPAFISSSSKRFKTNINKLSNSLESINKLQGVTFDWKDTGKSDIGLIAEEVNEVLPELVGKNDTGLPEGIDYGKITAVLIEAVKELTQKVSDLESKLQ